MNSLQRTEYHSELVEWLGRANWHTMLTLTHKNDRPGDWFFAKMTRLQNLFLAQHNVSLEWAASIEKTKAGVNHMHSLVRFNPRSPETFKCGSAVFPTDWIERQHAPAHALQRVVNAIHSICSTGVRGFPNQSSKDGLKALRSAELDQLTFLRMWYQGNYGCMADLDPIRSQSGVIAYALKYAMKEIDQPKLTWMVSKKAVPSSGN